MLVGGSFDNVPEKEIPARPGVYTCLIKSSDLKDKKDKDGNVTGQQIQTVLEIESDANGGDVGLETGKALFVFTDVKQKTQLLRLGLSAGLSRENMSNGLDIALLAGRRTKVLVTNSPSTKDGITTIYANVKDFLLPTDPIPTIKQG